MNTVKSLVSFSLALSLVVGSLVACKTADESPEGTHLKVTSELTAPSADGGAPEVRKAGGDGQTVRKAVGDGQTVRKAGKEQQEY